MQGEAGRGLRAPTDSPDPSPAAAAAVAVTRLLRPLSPRGPRRDIPDGSANLPPPPPGSPGRRWCHPRTIPLGRQQPRVPGLPEVGLPVEGRTSSEAIPQTGLQVNCGVASELTATTTS
jgi:hypothetical protein